MLVSKADGGLTQVLKIWREGGCKQELKLYLRRMVQIMEDLIANKLFACHQYLSFERGEEEEEMPREQEEQEKWDEETMEKR